MIGLHKQENKSEAERLLNQYGRTLYNDEGHLKSELEFLEMMGELWEELKDE